MPPAARKAAPRKAAARRPRAATATAELAADEAALESAAEEEAADAALAAVPEGLRFASDTAAAEARAEEVPTPFELDGNVYRALRPKDTVMITLLAATSRNATLQDQASAVMTWVEHCLDATSRLQLTNRLYDRADNLQYEDLADVMWSLLEYWDAQDAEAQQAVVAATGTRAERRAQKASPGARKVGGAHLAARARAAGVRR